MSRLHRCAACLQRLGRDQRGATIVEFAIIALPMCAILVGGLGLAHESYVRTVMQGALNDAARKASVENPALAGSGTTVEERVENTIRAIAGPVAVNSIITVTQTSYFEFSGIGNPEKLMTDNNNNGQFDDDDGDCWEDANDNGTFDADGGSAGGGGASDVVFYRANVTMPRLLPLDAFTPLSPTYVLDLETAVRTQPYGTQPTPPVLCGTAT